MIDNNQLTLPDETDAEPRVEPQAGTLERQTVASRVCERGMVTAEWAIGIVVAVSLAGLLLIFVVKGPGRELLTNVILKIINAVSNWGLAG